ncbi:MAG: DUF2945 domain-containing protein [Balneolales bacterium]
MRKAFHTGTEVEWDWENGTAIGKVKNTFTSEVVRQINGSNIRRKATYDNPAYMIIQEGGNQFLKSHSEIRRSYQDELL